MKKNSHNSEINILLISCYELGNQPVSTASLHAFLKNFSYKPSVLDLSTQKIDLKEIENYDFIAMSTPMHTALGIAVEATKMIREINKKCHVCFYGDYAHLNSDYLLDNIADSCISGEIQIPMLELIKSIENSQSSSAMKGINSRHKNKSPFIKKPDFKTPDRSFLPSLSHYNKLIKGSTHIVTGAVETSRGCKHQCLHCPITPIYEGRFFVIPEKIVLTDIRNLYGQGARHITFTDPDFLNGPTHSLRILRNMNKSFPKMTFDFTAKVEHLLKNKDIFPELKQLGCLFIVTALESLNGEILKKLIKGHTKKDFLKVLKIARETDISIRPSLIAFTPWTTPYDYMELLNFIEKNQLVYEIEPVQMSIRLLIPPGSNLLKLDDLKKYIVKFEPEKFIHTWKHPDPNMELLNYRVSKIAGNYSATSADPLEIFVAIKKEFFTIFPEMINNDKNIIFSVKKQTPKPPKLTESWFC
ncbi:MAG: CUAEP/CCAEP-tail radical SAM protein [Nitrospinota bacterium]|nr:CUAEP/CCAEP-tail radical SAM protein [Nitrospinota bacterium]